MNIKEALEVVNSKEVQQQKSMPIDKDYVPQVGDILSNDQHSLVTIENVYSLARKSLRVNRNYLDDLFKHEALKKIIQRKEIIWEQHKLDFRLFPNISTIHQYDDEEKSIEARKNLTYHMYCFYNDHNQFKRLYSSKYRLPPQRKERVIIGHKTMVRISHSLCKVTVIINDKPPLVRPCYHWYAKRAIGLGSLVNQQFIYRGNIYTMMEQYES